MTANTSIRTPNAKSTDLDDICSALCSGIEFFHTQNEAGSGARARTLFFALAGFLDERGIIDDLKMAASYTSNA